MKNWQFGGTKGKLLFGLGSMLALTALIAITGAWWVMKLERVNDEIVDAGLVVERQIKEWHRSTRGNTLRTLLLLKTNDPVREKELRIEIDETVRYVNGILRKLASTLREGPVAEAFFTATEKRLLYQKIRADAFREKAAGNEREVSRIVEQELLPAQERFQAAVQQLSDRQVVQVQELIASTNAQSEHVRLTVAVSTSITFALALLFWLTARKSSREVVNSLSHQLSESTELQQAILNSANFSIISTDINGMIRLFNNGAHRMLGYLADEVIARHTPGLLHDETEIAVRAQQLSLELGQPIKAGFEVLVARARGGLVDEQEWTYIRKDGSRLPVMVSVTALRDEQLALAGFLCIAYDLTERKKVDDMKNEFISTVSHELRTPLTSIRGSLGLLSGGTAGAIPAAAKDLLDIANNNCERLVRIINDILDIEKIESGNMPFNTVTQRILPLAKQAIGATQAYAAQFQVKFELLPDAEDAYAAVDADRITQVIVNLLSNAAKYSPPGASVEVQLVRQSGFLRLSVIDHGEGVDDDFRARVFQKFAQADSSDTRQKGGSGLGLSISKAIIEKHHGRIDFRSERGARTEFFFELPLTAIPAQASVNKAA